MARGPLKIERFMGRARLGSTTGGIASDLATQSEALDATARRLGRMADRAAVHDAEVAGTAAGLAGKPVLTGRSGLAGSAFDDAAIRTYADQLDIKMYREAEALSLKHDRDPAGLETGLDALKQTMLSQDVLDHPVARAAFERSFERVRLGYERAAGREALARAQRAQAATATQALVASRDNLVRSAYALGLDPDAETTTAEELGKVRTVLKRATASGAIAPGEAARLDRELEEDRALAHYKGAFDRTPAAERPAFIEGLAADYKVGKGLAAKLDFASFERLTGHLETQINADEVDTSKAATKLRLQAEAVQKVASEGYGVAPAQWQTLETAAAAVPGGTETVAALRQEAEWFHSLAGRPAVDAEKAVSERKAQTGAAGATPLEVAAIGRADGFLKTMTTALKEDPLGWAERAGLAAPAPLDFAGPPDQFGERVAQAEAVAAHYGVPPVYLRPQEKAAIASAIEQGGAPMMAQINAITAGFGSRAPRVLREVSRAAPLLAHVGGIVLSGGSQQLAADVADAIAMRRDPNFKPANWDAAPFRDAAAALYGSAFDGAPDARAAAETTAKTAFEARAYRRGYAPKLGDADSQTAFDRTLQEAAGATFDRDGNQYGGIGEHDPGGWWSTGYKVVVPPQIRADRFTDVVDAVRDADLGGVMKASDLHGAHLVAIGPGRYRVALGDPAGDDPQWQQAADGSFFVLDLNALEPALRPRVPGAFK